MTTTLPDPAGHSGRPSRTERTTKGRRAAGRELPERTARGTLTRRLALGGGVAVLAGAGGTAGWAYDRFLREKVEVSDVAAAEAEAGTAAQTTAASTGAAGTFTQTGYTSGTTALALMTAQEGTGSDTVTWYAAAVRVTDATVIRAAFAQDKVGQNITELPSAIAERAGAVLAINGDYYGFRATGIVIRNGVAYRDEPAREGLAFYADGSVRLYDETATSAEALLAEGVWNTLSFGPAMLVDGAVPDGVEEAEVDTNVGNHSIQGNQPRTAIGVIDANHLVFLVVDGRSEGYSRGATLPELGEILAGLGCTTGYNLDGGGSSVMIFDGRIVNQPSNNGERATSDILYVAA